MSVSRVKIWIAGDILTAADLNTEFDAAMGTQMANPMTTVGDIIYGGTDGAATRLASSTRGLCLTAGGAATAPSWVGMTTQGDVEYHNGTTRTRLGAGTAGQSLTTGGASANPAWAGMTTSGDIEYHNGTTRTRLAKGTGLQVLRMNAGATAPEWGSTGAWAVIPAANYTATPASTSTITMGVDMTATVLVGKGLRYTIGAVEYFGLVSAIAANLLTVNGAPLGGDVSNLQYGDNRVEQIDFYVNGYYEDATNTDLITSDLGGPFIWYRKKAYLVAYKVWSAVHDSHATHGKATIYINNTEVNTSAGGLTIAADATWYATVIDIATAAYDINNGEELEICVTKGGTGDARDLRVSCLFVYP